MNKFLKGKILLIIGGAAQHCKVVEAAKSLGVVTYVTDYLPPEKAPAKQMADKYFMYNITEIDEIVAMCRKEGVDGRGDDVVVDAGTPDAFAVAGDDADIGDGLRR